MARKHRVVREIVLLSIRLVPAALCGILAYYGFMAGGHAAIK
jgi:hypothetical protein